TGASAGSRTGAGAGAGARAGAGAGARAGTGAGTGTGFGFGKVRGLLLGRENLLGAVVVADGVVVRHHALEVDEQMVRAVGRLGLRGAGGGAVVVVRERGLALVRLVALVLVRYLLDAREERAEGAVAHRVAGVGEGAVLAGLGGGRARGGVAGLRV